MKIALVGNPNCGKTTLFNRITGNNQHVGNFPGVTVEKKEGIIKKLRNATVIDLPGVYSMSTYTMEEIITRDVLLNENIDIIINLIDVTNIERSLYLSLQLLELEIPMIIALNMVDELLEAGGKIDINKIEEMLGVPVIPVSAIKNEGIENLIKKVGKVVRLKQKPLKINVYEKSINLYIKKVEDVIKGHAIKNNLPIEFTTLKVIENEKTVFEKLNLDNNEKEIIENIRNSMEKTKEIDINTLIINEKYSYIEKVITSCIKKKKATKKQEISIKIDKIVTNEFFGIPIFLSIMLLIFYLTFGVLGPFFNEGMSIFVDIVSNKIENSLEVLQVNAALQSLIIDGIIAGVGSVLSFLPTIVILFFFLAMLEDSGYMARVAFVMDSLLRKVGLSGKSIVPMIIGFGCSVPAIMATRTLASQKDRKLTMMIIPYMSCSAKLPIYSIFSMTFFKDNASIAMFLLYILGICTAIICSLILKKTVFKGDDVPFVMELPVYRLPTLRSMIMQMEQKAIDFIYKAFTIIFLATIIIWFMQNFSITLNKIEDNSKSILAFLGNLIAPIFVPLGFGDWRVASALITGLTAKETVISTLTILLNVSEASLLPQYLSSIFTPVTAISFLSFTLLYMPCVATFTTMKRELCSLKKAVYIMMFQTMVAWIISFFIYNIARFIIK